MRYRPDPSIAHVGEWLEWQGRRLEQNFHEAQRFLQVLDPKAARFSFRTFSDTPYTRLPGRDPLERAIHGELRDCWEQLMELNHKGAAVSVTINSTNGQGREVIDIKQVRALFLDDDNPPQNLGRFLLPPHIQVATSPGHYHHYWLVEGLPLSRFSELQRRLAHRYGGDNKVLALNQSMQLPGIWRRKNPSQPLLPAIQRINSGKTYQAEEVQKLLTSVDCMNTKGI